MTDPEVVLLDEPLAGVNPTLEEKLLDRIHQLREDGYTFLLVEHDMDVIMNNCEHVIVMHQGSVLAEGTGDEIRNNEQVIEAYLGRTYERRGGRLRRRKPVDDDSVDSDDTPVAADMDDTDAGTTHTLDGDAILRLRDLDAGYGDLQILSDVDPTTSPTGSTSPSSAPTAPANRP